MARTVTLTLPDPERRLVGARVVSRPELRRTEFERSGDTWVLRTTAPDVDRLEYLLELHHPDGSSATVLDPHNERLAAGPFGAKSVLELPGYRPPMWLQASQPRGVRSAIEIPVPELDAVQRGRLWASPGLTADEPAPLLVAFDGPEYDDLAHLGRYLDWLDVEGGLPPFRAALLQPIRRNDHYAADPIHTHAIAGTVLPALAAGPAPHRAAQRVAMGASLGAVAALHLHRTEPGSVGGLFLQSGSFFTPRFDQHEILFSRWLPLVDFAGRCRAARPKRMRPVPTVIACGTGEENLACNLAMAEGLERQGYPLATHWFRDGHTWTGWRDSFHPHLGGLLRRVWRAPIPQQRTPTPVASALRLVSRRLVG